MLNKLKLIPLMMAAALGLQACGDDDPRTANLPRQMADVNAGVYSLIRQNPTANALFAGTGATNVGDEKCAVKVYRMNYGTVGGAGETATSSGVFMMPYGSDPACTGDRPVLLYAHGTTSEKNYDLSQFIIDSDNAASTEAVMLLAAYASQGYAVIAPNYAGYADSSLSYHPYMDQTQQSTEMMNALDHVRETAGMLGASLSSELFVSGLSQGGYVAMATHKALEASGEKVTASLPISGPYAMRDFIDTIFAGYVNAGATTFAPLALTAIDKASDIYSDPSEVYTSVYAASAESALPAVGGMEKAVTDGKLPPMALFSGTPPEGANPINQAGFGQNHLINDAFRTAYLTDAATNPTDPQNKFRMAVNNLDLRGWTPQAPMLMCGSNRDAVVYFSNTTTMAQEWSALMGAGLVSVLDLSADLTSLPASTPDATKGLLSNFQNSNFGPGTLHAQTGAFCSMAGLSYFGEIRARAAAAAAAAN